jgi:hypothetical protein
LSQEVYDTFSVPKVEASLLITNRLAYISFTKVLSCLHKAIDCIGDIRTTKELTVADAKAMEVLLKGKTQYS